MPQFPCRIATVGASPSPSSFRSSSRPLSSRASVLTICPLEARGHVSFPVSYARLTSCHASVYSLLLSLLSFPSSRFSIPFGMPPGLPSPPGLMFLIVLAILVLPAFVARMSLLFRSRLCSSLGPNWSHFLPRPRPLFSSWPRPFWLVLVLFVLSVSVSVSVVSVSVSIPSVFVSVSVSAS